MSLGLLAWKCTPFSKPCNIRRPVPRPSSGRTPASSAERDRRVPAASFPCVFFRGSQAACQWMLFGSERYSNKVRKPAMALATCSSLSCLHGS